MHLYRALQFIIETCILRRERYPTFKIHSGYIRDTMYPELIEKESKTLRESKTSMNIKFKIHGTQDTFMIQVGYIHTYMYGLHRDTHQDTYLEPYLFYARRSWAWAVLG